MPEVLQLINFCVRIHLFTTNKPTRRGTAAHNINARESQVTHRCICVKQMQQLNDAQRNGKQRKTQATEPHGDNRTSCTSNASGAQLVCTAADVRRVVRPIKSLPLSLTLRLECCRPDGQARVPQA